MEYSYITFTCMNCKQQFYIEQSKILKEIPEGFAGMICNWCPCCENINSEVYHEWYLYDAPAVCPTERARQLKLEI